MRKFLLLAILSITLLPAGQAGAAAIEDGAEICTPKRDCKMLLNILPTPITSVKTVKPKKQCKVTWAFGTSRPEMFSATEPLPDKTGCKAYMAQNLGRWWRVKERPNTPRAVFLEPIPLKYDTWR
jgi:hypothetical protein